jgi:sugar lactone lactonase YvrE
MSMMRTQTPLPRRVLLGAAIAAPASAVLASRAARAQAPAPATAPAPAASAPVVLPTQQDPRLVAAYQADRVWNGVTTTRDGRVFVGFPQADRPGVRVAEIMRDGSFRAYPNAVWNGGVQNGDVGDAFVLINSLRIGPEGDLWLVDAGAPGIGKPALKGGARLFRINVGANEMTRIYDLSSVAGPRSFVDDVRFNGRMAYLTDAGMPGLIVLDLQTGAARRVLENDRSTTDQRAMYADGRMLVDPEGHEVRVHADQLEVSPDGATLYYQPASGPMWRVPTSALDDVTMEPAAVARRVQPFADTPTTGGTAIDAQGNIYVADENNRRILRYAPDGSASTLVADPRLVWVDAMWIDHNGDLWMPAAQLNLVPGMNRGVGAVHYPVVIYKMRIGIGPPASDHP